MTGLESDIAFKAIDNHHYPRNIRGEIKNSEGKLIAFIYFCSTALFLDEMPMMEPADMSHVAMNDVALIKIFNPPFMGGFGNGAGGAIAVYTRKGGDDLARRGKGLETGSVVGYSVLKEFYSPDYATHHMMHEVSDVRSTLYWSPYVLTDKNNKKIKIEFYNNDLSTSFKVILEGINEEGKLTRLEKIIQ